MRSFFRRHTTAKPPRTRPQSGASRLLPRVAASLAVFTVAAVPTLFLNSVYGYLPVLVVLFAVGFSALYILAMRASLVYTQTQEIDRCRRGESLDFAIRLKNRLPILYPKLESWFAVSDLFSGDDRFSSSTMALAPLEVRDCDFPVRFDHLGVYEAGVRQVVMHDLLGLFSGSMKGREVRRIHVEPRVFALDRAYISDTLSDSEIMLVPTPTDGSEYAGVREYVWGDPIKTIHWKLSARSEDYLTKQFEGYGTVGVTVVMDFVSPAYDTETLMSLFDCVVETALSVGFYAEQNGMEYEFVYADQFGERREFNKGHFGKGYFSGFTELINDMPRMTVSTGVHKGLDLLKMEGLTQHAHGNIVFCTADVNQQLVDVILQLKMRKKHPVLFAAVPDSLQGEERDRFLKPLRLLSGAGITWLALSDASELGDELR